MTKIGSEKNTFQLELHSPNQDDLPSIISRPSLLDPSDVLAPSLVCSRPRPGGERQGLGTQGRESVRVDGAGTRLVQPGILCNTHSSRHHPVKDIFRPRFSRLVFTSFFVVFVRREIRDINYKNVRFQYKTAWNLSNIYRQKLLTVPIRSWLKT